MKGVLMYTLFLFILIQGSLCFLRSDDELTNECQNSLDTLYKDMEEASKTYNLTSVYICSLEEYKNQTKDGHKKDVYINCTAPLMFKNACLLSEGSPCDMTFAFKHEDYLVDTLLTICLPKTCIVNYQDYVFINKQLDESSQQFCSGNYTECKAQLKCERIKNSATIVLIVGGVIVLLIIIGFGIIALLVYFKRNDPEIVHLMNTIQRSPMVRHDTANMSEMNIINENQEENVSPLIIQSSTR